MNAFVSIALTRMDGSDCQLVALPLFHSFGQSVQMNAVLWAGATMALLPRFDPDAALAAMQRHGVSIFAGVPTMYIAILNLPGAEERHDIAAIAARLRIGVSGGAAMPVEVMRRFEERFGIAILEGYGLSETSPVATFSFLEFPRIPGSVGRAIAGTRVRVVDGDGRDVAPGETGEVVVRGHNVMKGYYRRPEETATAIRDGWFHTGDIGRLDEEANLYIVDRLKDMIIRGGFNVYPRELEEVLMTHEAVAQVAVIGVPHATHGEEVKAVLTLRPGKSATPEAIVAWCQERMAAYKYPRLVEIVPSLPMTATGKILKRALKG
jgi:long-chain acyl-CoA synthetase